MLSFSNLGALDLLRSNASRSSFPGIYFATLPKTQILLENLAMGAYSTETPRDFLADFGDVKFDCYASKTANEFDDRQLSHLNFLILACIFASQDRWGAAYGHAMRAQSAIERLDQEIPVLAGSRSNMSGRESQFLIATCLRMKANSTDDFVKAEAKLSAARRSLRNDMVHNPATDGAIHDVRLANEELALRLCKYYFLRSEKSDAPLAYFSVPSLAIYSSVEKHSRRFEKVFQTILSSEHNEVYRNKAVLTCGSLSRHILEVFVVSKFRNEVVGDRDFHIIFLELCRRALIWSNKRIEQEHYFEPRLTKFYRLSVGNLYGEHHFPGFRSISHLETLFRQILPNEMGDAKDVSIYDEWRIRALRSFVLERGSI